MKTRYFVAILLAVVIVGILLYYTPQPLQKRLDINQNTTCSIFCRQTALDCVNLGFGYAVTCNGVDFCKTLSQCNDIDGVSFSYSAQSLDEVSMVVTRLQVEVHSSQIFDDLVVLCGYSPKINCKTFVDGKVTNVQIAFDGATLTVGSPLILGSY